MTDTTEALDAGTNPPRPGNRRRRFALWGTLAVLIVAAGALVVTRDAPDDDPPPLALALGASRGAEAASAADAMLAAPVTYVAADGLPALGGSGAVHRLDPPTDDRVTALAQAFGIEGEVTSADGARRVVDGSVQLDVYGTSWSFYDSAGAGGVVGVDTGVACAEPRAGEEPPPCDVDAPAPERPADLPTEDQARDLALTALDRAGFDTAGASVRVDDVFTAWSVGVDLAVDGETVPGYSLYLSVGSSGAITDGGGVIGDLVEIDDYPLIDTRAAIDRLNDQFGFAVPMGGPAPLGDQPVATDDEAVAPDVRPPPLDEPCKVQPDGREICEGVDPVIPPECELVGGDAVVCPDPGVIEPLPEPLPEPEPIVEPEPVVVTLGTVESSRLLIGSWDGTETYLVPAYRFSGADPDGNAYTDVTAVAIDDAFLTQPVDPGGTDVPVPVPDPVPEPGPSPEPDPCVLVEDDGTGTTHTVIVPDCGGQTEPGDPGADPGAESGYADVILGCGDIAAFDGRWWHTDDPVEQWNDVTEGGTLTVDPVDPDVATFVGDAQASKTATFRAMGPAAEYPGCD